jgi:hypothetical protein
MCGAAGRRRRTAGRSFVGRRMAFRSFAGRRMASRSFVALRVAPSDERTDARCVAQRPGPAHPISSKQSARYKPRRRRTQAFAGRDDVITCRRPIHRSWQSFSLSFPSEPGRKFPTTGPSSRDRIASHEQARPTLVHRRSTHSHNLIPH